MIVKKNGMELTYITLQQFSSSVDELTFSFEKPKDLLIDNTIVQIIYETDKLDSIKNDNITLLEDLETNTIIISWLIKDSITLTTGNKRVQIVIKDGNKVYLTYVFMVRILESLQVDDEITITNLTYLEYWEQRVTELLNKVEQFEGLNFENFATKDDILATLLDYPTKQDLDDLRTDLEQAKQDINDRLDSISVGVSNERNKRIFVTDTDDGINFTVDDFATENTNVMHVYVMGTRQVKNEEYIINGKTLTLLTDPLEVGQFIDLVFREVSE